ncbi:tenascin [Eurytemora carolleeae]|uniref:tenascin n=1 Tax=Eurytemora carolleeae TaxID=1294199 RepID=UPI000C76BCE2|nr:tenascin [Eurytemora carolleeae]|eukprot:XP_023348027.1 tenascin-like [Eurytemora affinis]
MLLLLLFVCVLSIVSVFCSDCEFSKNCYKTKECKTIQDAGCICRFGSCIVTGRPFTGNFTPECKVFTDCSCSKTPETCFCNDGTCVSDPKEKWECHDKNSTECAAMKKCFDTKCTCRGNLCEHDCNTVEDCINGDFPCARSIGSECGCEENLCTYVLRPKQCDEISNCVEKGKCTGNAPCACTENQCVHPSFAKSESAEKLRSVTMLLPTVRMISLLVSKL